MNYMWENQVLGLAQNRQSFTGTSYCIKMKNSTVFKEFLFLHISLYGLLPVKSESSVVARVRIRDLQRKSKSLCLLLSSMISLPAHFRNNFPESQTFHSQSISVYVKAQDWRDGPRVLF